MLDFCAKNWHKVWHANFGVLKISIEIFLFLGFFLFLGVVGNWRADFGTEIGREIGVLKILAQLLAQKLT